MEILTEANEMVNRNPLWNTLLAEFIQSRLLSPFVWGENDCCLFACDAVLAMTGTDLAANFRGKYNTQISAYKLVKSYAGGGLAEFADKIATENNISEVALNFATAGDVVLVAGDQGDTLGFVELNGREVLATGPQGLMRVEKTNWKKAWKI
jgi:uncharacterized protein DUF6950